MIQRQHLMRRARTITRLGSLINAVATLHCHRCRILRALMQHGEVRGAKVNIGHVHVVQFLCDILGGLFAEDRLRDLLCHETVHIPVVIGQLSRIFLILKNHLSKSA